MYNSIEYDSEDDEGYFLTPVLHYNISDKIIEANKILFDNKEQELANNNNDMNVKKSAQGKRCVIFAEELVSFAHSVALEPDSDEEAAETNACISTVIEEQENLEVEEVIENEITSEVNEIVNAIDKQLLLAQKEQEAEQQNKIRIADESRKKSLLALDPPYPNTYRKTTEQKIVSSSIETTALINNNNNIKHTDKTNEQTTKTVEKPTTNKSKHVNRAKNSQRNADNSKCAKTNATPKFNYKICCEYAAVYTGRQSRLPQYKGYISEYGLSRRQRDNLLQLNKRMERSQLEQETRAQEQFSRRMTANEQAFSVWLLNKCRNAPNRTRNMFDYKSTTSHTAHNNLVKNNKCKVNKFLNEN